MNIYSTKEEFENLDYFEPTDEFNGIVIVPTNELHDSGFGCMKFALINGIGGYGKYEDYHRVLKTGLIKRVDWSIDCLPNGLIRLFCSEKLDIDKLICSDFNLYVK